MAIGFIFRYKGRVAFSPQENGKFSNSYHVLRVKPGVFKDVLLDNLQLVNANWVEGQTTVLYEFHTIANLQISATVSEALQEMALSDLLENCYQLALEH